MNPCPLYGSLQMMSNPRDSETVIRYKHGGKNIERNAVNFLCYKEE